MKNILVIISLLLFVRELSYSQSNLHVSIKDCRQEGRFAYLHEFKVFRNDSLIKTIEPEHVSQQTLKDLDFGMYRIEYRTMFKKTESVTVELSEKKKYSVDLCINYINHESDSSQLFIDQLKIGESYSIQVSSRGCFHSSDETITINRNSDAFYCTYQDTQKKLDNDDIKAIRYFEIEVNNMMSVGCTTIDSYFLKYKDTEVYIRDGSCSWNGAYYLKKELNLISE